MKLGPTLIGVATFLVLGHGPAPVAAQEGSSVERGSVSGTVSGRFQAEVVQLGFATIQALAPGYRQAVVADSLGRYALPALPAGPVQLRVTHPGHDPLILEVLVPPGGSVEVDLELTARPVELLPVEITRNPRIPPPGIREVDPDVVERVESIALESGVGVSMPGLVEAVRSLPGSDPANATDVLFMRGSTTDLKLVLLDGAPVFTPFHVAGLLTTFEPSTLDRATLHVGGAPARYDGGLTYILDLGTRRPSRDRMHVSGSLDLLSGSLGVDSPLGSKAGVLVSGRALHNLGDGPLGGVSPYGYEDLLTGIEFEPAPGHLFNARGFWNRESVVLDYGAPTPGVGNDDAWWANRSAGLTYHGRWGDLEGEVTVAGSGYDASLPLLPGTTPEDMDPDPLLATATTERVRIVAEVARPSPKGTSRMGFSWESQNATYGARPLLQGGSVSQTLASARAAGAFVDVTRTLSRYVTVRVGLRADDLTGVRGGIRFAPRGSLSWTVGPQAYLTVAAGRYHQHARATDFEVERALTDVVQTAAPGTDLLPVATADHVVLSLDQAFGERTRLGIEGFWKGYTGLRDPADGPIRSSGIDLRLRTVGDGKTAWLGYGLSWFWAGQGFGGQSDFAGRHMLTAGLSGRVFGPVVAVARLSYGAGLPYTAIPFGSSDGEMAVAGPDDTRGTVDGTPPLAGGLDEEFLRVDLEVRAVLSPRWGGRTWELRPYVRILNALDRRDALFYTFQPWRDASVRPLAQRPLLPVFGISWKF
jgi:hypothetical protein